MAALTAAVMLVSGLAPAAQAVDDVAARLEPLLRQQGAEAVNDQLHDQAFELALLHRDTEACRARAIDLTLALSRGSRSKVTEAHTDALRTALGRCPGLVLPRLSPAEVPRVCAAASSWTVMQTVRELRRRMRLIEADEALRTSPRGQACSAACLHELQTTRAGLRAARSR
ncbi:MAG: hypothetical protein KF891_07695 [Rhizobacter sp.]|nr:hypothetical protein [Rhizobacter sp.]